ncbi:NUDIX domain-containing protein [Limibacillus halophilus]|uniref:ADP-ribose pyrophosphatase n=1 Tax=Limibacillus halophilus TaxID=1579333 RepID=A0A839SRV5_9PROT|nr:NUDIX domain-containing protein [Limibacillus halophilus]MBB3065521.1 ADP-ribose pyrophosphatase [Limibacillus halophilus]
MDDPRIEIHSRKTGFKGFFALAIFRLRHRRHDGGWTREIEREVFLREPVVAVLPYDPVRNTILLLEQFRLPAHLIGQDAWQQEIIAGIVEEGENLEDVAVRECQEEAGFKPLALEKIMTYMPSQGACTEATTIFLAHMDDAGLGGVHGLEDEDEDILARVLPFDEAWAMLEEGRIQNSPAIIALQWLKLNRQDVTKRWNT